MSEPGRTAPEPGRTAPEPGRTAPGPGLRLDIGRVTLHGYSPGRRDRFATAIAARLTGHGVAAEAARQAAEAILALVDARLDRGRDHA